jgi:diguanylate cyclase (GGDEF)-like protein
MPYQSHVAQGVRILRRFGSTTLTSLMYLCILWIVHRVGFLDDEQFYIAGTATIACIGVFGVLIFSGWNEGRTDPSLSIPMIIASSSVNTYVLYAMDGAGSAFLLVYLVSLLFGVFHLSTRQMLRVAGFILILYGTTIWLRANHGTVGADLRMELLQWAVLGFVVVWFSIMVGFISTLMARLGESEFDELTGAYTRRRIMEILRHEKVRTDRGAGPLSVCLLDLDNLKHINDKFGHQGGDLQLKTVVSAVQGELRSIDYIGRYGGDEFLVVLTQTPSAGARDCAERFRRALESFALNEASPRPPATVSIGIGEYQPGETVAQIVARADAALYQAKKAGRNRIEFATTNSSGKQATG